MVLYPYQQRVKELLLDGRSVILQAPTGAGKTRAALAPYIEAFFERQADSFPRKCIYSVPMRVLANQFFEETEAAAQRYARLFQAQLDVRVQTGERSGDPRLMGNLIFATIDQSLSSALAVPYSLTPGLANLNAGAFCASYLIFDEFHLFPSSGEERAEGALATTLQLLMRLKGRVPFILMTATFSSTMLERLAALLEATVVTVPVGEYQMIARGAGERPRSRTFQVYDEPLSAERILATHARRTIAICNQVQRAQKLYCELRRLTAGSEIEVLLLHSRYTAGDRQQKEGRVRAEFGPTDAPGKSLILVATQVIEVGLNITCEHLYTEIAPANAILQRAGRCARYVGEQGTVHIFRPPQREHPSQGGEPQFDYLPYTADLCERSWASFAARQGRVVDFQEEQRIVDEVHTEADGQLLDAMARQEGMLWSDIMSTLDTHDAALRSKLIRRIDGVTVLVAANPQDVGNPFATEGFSLFRGSVVNIWRQLAADLSSNAEGEIAWRMAYPSVQERDPDDPASTPDIRWHEVTDAELLWATPVVVINQAFCAYDADLGFRIVPPDQANRWSSPPGLFAVGNNRPGFGYRLERYDEHVRTMLTIFDRNFAADYAYLQRRLVERHSIPPGSLLAAVRLAIVCHDLAKLDKRWQRWVRAYQAAIDEPLTDDHYMAVHTHWNPTEEQHRRARQQADRQGKRPHHAGESAVAVSQIIAELIGQASPAIGRAICTAIARHHSPKTAAFEDYELHPDAATALHVALAEAGFPAVASGPVMSRRGRNLEPLLIRPDFDHQLLYLLIVRALRLCDGLSQEG